MFRTSTPMDLPVTAGGARSLPEKAALLWRLFLFGGIALFSLRYLIGGALVSECPPAIFVLISGAVYLGLTSSAPGLLALAAATPLLNALPQVGVSFGAPPVETLFAGLFLGWFARKGWAARYRLNDFSVVTLAADSFCTFALISTFEIAWRNYSSMYGISSILGIVFAPSDPRFGLSAGYVLLIGVGTFRLICVEVEPGPHVSRVVASIMIVHLATIFTCITFQLSTKIPPLYGTHLGGAERSWMPTLPGDDIHTLGTMSVVVFAFSLISSGPPFARQFWRVISLCALAVVIYSWSRAAWLAAFLLVILYSSYRFGKRIVPAFMAGMVICVGSLALTSPNDISNDRTYLRRFADTFDMVHWVKNNPDRIELYKRAASMCLKHPFRGVGVGQYFRVSPNYASAGVASPAKFAHNALLQIAAELGIPAALSWLIWITSLLLRGSPRRYSPVNTSAAVWLAAIGFLLTQFTANAINIWSYQQLIFSFLIGISFVAAKNKVDLCARTARGGDSMV